MVTEHYCFVNPYCFCVVSDNQYPINIITSSTIALSICSAMCPCRKIKTVPDYLVPGTSLCISATVQALIGTCLTRAAQTVYGVASLDTTRLRFLEIRLHMLMQRSKRPPYI